MATNVDISLDECTCQVCMCILIEPVRMPCGHELCMTCFHQNVFETSLTCPFCRMRIASWARRGAKYNTLIDEKRWKYIKKSFPEKVKRKLEGKDSSDEDEELIFPKALAEPGAIRREYEEEKKKLEAELDRRRLEEEAASRALIEKLRTEEELSQSTLLEQTVRDAQLAVELCESTTPEIDLKTPTSLSGEGVTVQPVRSRSASLGRTLIDTFVRRSSRRQYPDSCSPSASEQAKLWEGTDRLVPKTLFSDPSTSQEAIGGRSFSEPVFRDDTVSPRRKLCSGQKVFIRELSRSNQRSTDSMAQEMVHFRPIKVCPRTPPKRLPSGQLLDPPLIRSTPHHPRMPQSNATAATCLPSLNLLGGSPIVQRRLEELAVERQTQVDCLSKGTSTNSHHMMEHVFKEHNYSSPKKNNLVEHLAETRSGTENPRKDQSRVEMEEGNSREAAVGTPYDIRPLRLNLAENPMAIGLMPSNIHSTSPGKIYKMKISSKREKRRIKMNEDEVETKSSHGSIIEWLKRCPQQVDCDLNQDSFVSATEQKHRKQLFTGKEYVQDNDVPQKLDRANRRKIFKASESSKHKHMTDSSLLSSENGEIRTNDNTDTDHKRNHSEPKECCRNILTSKHLSPENTFGFTDYKTLSQSASDTSDDTVGFEENEELNRRPDARDIKVRRCDYPKHGRKRKQKGKCKACPPPGKICRSGKVNKCDRRIGKRSQRMIADGKGKRSKVRALLHDTVWETEEKRTSIDCRNDERGARRKRKCPESETCHSDGESFITDSSFELVNNKRCLNIVNKKKKSSNALRMKRKRRQHRIEQDDEKEKDGEDSETSEILIKELRAPSDSKSSGKGKAHTKRARNLSPQGNLEHISSFSEDITHSDDKENSMDGFVDNANKFTGESCIISSLEDGKVFRSKKRKRSISESEIRNKESKRMRGTKNTNKNKNGKTKTRTIISSMVVDNKRKLSKKSNASVDDDDEKQAQQSQVEAKCCTSAERKKTMRQSATTSAGKNQSSATMKQTKLNFIAKGSKGTTRSSKLSSLSTGVTWQIGGEMTEDINLDLNPRHFETEEQYKNYTEERDRLLALRLQADFDAEAKFHLTAIRSKGSEGEYSLRRRKTRKAGQKARRTKTQVTSH